VSLGRFNTDSQDTILAMPIDLLFDFLGVRIIGEKASEVDFRINFTFAEHGDEWTMWVRNGVLNAQKGHVEGARLSVSGPKPALAGVLLQPGEARELIDKASVAVDGDLGVLDTLASVTDTFDPAFNIVTP
jgi:alkyl sulfatase BDS1-like metallo-beta-lactamase superfamily hydrolase